MILTEIVEVTLNGANLKHYENLGYEIPRHKNNSNSKMQFKSGTKIKVFDNLCICGKSINSSKGYLNEKEFLELIS